MSTALERTWEEFFTSGFYIKAWISKTDLGRTEQEVEGVLNLLKPKPGSHILDWCGGWGRHAVIFAKKGFKVTLLDFTPHHITRAQDLAQEAGVSMTFVCSDFRETPKEIQADYAVNLFTSGLGYLTEDDDIEALKSLNTALKPGGKVLIDTMNLFWLVLHYMETSWSEDEEQNIRILEKRWFDNRTNRNYSKVIVVGPEGEKARELNHRVYTERELRYILEKGGFKTLAVYGDFEGNPPTFNTKRLIVLAEKQ